MNLAVLNVGDGACSILEVGADLAVLDCGTWGSTNGRGPATVLANALGKRVELVNTLVVSHFDADHWRGLQYLPHSARASLAPEVTIYYPGLPACRDAPARTRQVLAGTMALITLNNSAGRGGSDPALSVRAVDLIAAWRKVTRVQPRPLFAGSRMRFGSRDLRVLWPPSTLPQAWSSAAAEALSDLHDVAEGVPGLPDLIEEAYGDNWALTGQEQARAEALEDRSAEMDDFPDVAPEGVSAANRLTGLEAEQGQGQGHGPVFVKLPGVETKTVRRLNRVVKKLGALNNHLSLAFDDGRGGLLTLGDLQDWSLRRVTRRLDPSYSIALAPHHGTVPVPDDFPDVTICVLQNGSRHSRNATNHWHARCLPVGTNDHGHLLNDWFFGAIGT